MTSRDPAFRCAADSLLRGDALAGTASTVRAFLLVENTGPWGVEALRDARLPDGLGHAVGHAAAGAKVRPLLVRRPDRQPHQDGVLVFAAYAHPTRPWIESTVLADPRELLDLDLDALGAGRSPGLTPYDGSLFCVCTHGRHDACCAERGRPVVGALGLARPDETWEVSHIGGDRFAGNLLVLPHGFYYGRLTPDAALAVAGAHADGEIDLEHFRGRSGLSMPVQFAEIVLRRQLGEARDRALRLVGRTVEDHVTRAVFDVAGSTWLVQVRTVPGAELAQLTCRASRDNPIPAHEVLSIARA